MSFSKRDVYWEYHDPFAGCSAETRFSLYDKDFEIENDFNVALLANIDFPSSYDHLLLCGRSDCPACNDDLKRDAINQFHDDQGSEDAFTDNGRERSITRSKKIGLRRHRRREPLKNSIADLPLNVSGNFLGQLLRKSRKKPRRSDKKKPLSWKNQTRAERQYLANPRRWSFDSN